MVAGLRISFLLKLNTTFCLFTHLLVDPGCAYLLSVVTNAARNLDVNSLLIWVVQTTVALVFNIMIYIKQSPNEF